MQAGLTRHLALPQDELYQVVPWLLIALADAEDGDPARARRLKAAAMQLLPPLLDDRHARRLSGMPDRGRIVGLTPEHNQTFFNTLVRTGAALAGASTAAPCPSFVHRLTPNLSVHAACFYCSQSCQSPCTRGRCDVADATAPAPCLWPQHALLNHLCDTRRSRW